MTSKKTIAFIAHNLTQYRLPFHEAVRSILADNGIGYQLYYGAPGKLAAAKKDAVQPSWAQQFFVQEFSVYGKTAHWQPVWSLIKDADLTIIGQHNSYLTNYALQMRYLMGGQKIALFGHGRTPPYSPPQGLADHWKRVWATKAHWWFAYTQGVADIVAGYGFPRERITVFNNAIDTTLTRAEMDDISSGEIEALRAELGLKSENIGIYIGSMYREKRVDLAIEAALLIRQQIPDFELLLIGAGVESEIAAKAAREHAFIHYPGPKFGRDKTMHAMLARVFLLPGVIGLAVLDAFAYGLPMVTTAVSGHGPEIDYLVDGKNGVIVRQTDSPQHYANAVVDLLENEDKRQALIIEGHKCADLYTIENMAERFANGIMAALDD